jgi:acylphosphatase
VIADGTVYMYSYRPSPQSEPVLKGNPFWERTYKDDDDFKAQMAKAKANERETGWVRNLPDGRVELVAEGPSGDLDQLLAEVSHGPPAARVDKVETKEEPPTGEFKGFGVRN